MPDGSRLRSLRAYGLVLAVGLTLIAAPLWVPALHLDDPTVTYERAEIVANADEGVHHADESRAGRATPISDEIGCTDMQNDYRICGFERYLLGDVTVPSGWLTTNPNRTTDYQTHRFQFVQIEGQTYRPATVVNESVQRGNGMYRIDLTLESVPPKRALDAVARNPDAERPPVDPVVREAAATGTATSHRDIDDLATVFEVGNGTYYRVYRAGSTPPIGLIAIFDPLLTVFLPGLGLGTLLVIGSDVRTPPPDGDQD